MRIPSQDFTHHSSLQSFRDYDLDYMNINGFVGSLHAILLTL